MTTHFTFSENEGTSNNIGIPVADVNVSSSSVASSKSPGNVGGRSNSSINYSTTEHDDSMLDIIAGIPGAYECSVGSPTWQGVHTRLNSSRCFIEFETLAYEVESVCSTLTNDIGNHRIVESNSEHIMRCVLEVYVDGTQSKLNIIEYYGALSEAQIALGLASLIETANFSKDLILGNDFSRLD